MALLEWKILQARSEVRCSQNIIAACSSIAFAPFTLSPNHVEEDTWWIEASGHTRILTLTKLRIIQQLQFILQQPDRQTVQYYFRCQVSRATQVPDASCRWYYATVKCVPTRRQSTKRYECDDVVITPLFSSTSVDEPNNDCRHGVRETAMPIQWEPVGYSQRPAALTKAARHSIPYSCDARC